MKKNLSNIILIGSVWGITEATLGSLLHTFALGIGWMFWFPVAYLFLYACYKLTASYPAVLMTAMIASALKLVNLIHTPRYDTVLNPAVSILLEAMSAVAVYSFINRSKTGHTLIPEIISVGFAWRALYLCYVFALPKDWIAISPAADSLSLARFLFFENIINTTCILLILKAWEKISTVLTVQKTADSRIKRLYLRRLLAAACFCVAVAAQIIF